MAQVKMMIFFLLLTLNLVIAVQEENCPAQEDIYPCTCSKKSGLLEVLCQKGTADVFQKAFNHLRGKSLNVVEFFCLLAPEPCTIKASVIYDLKIQKLELNNVELEGTLDAKSRETMSHLTELTIKRSTRLARELSNWDLGGLKNLKVLVLALNNMTEISNKMFKTGPKSLERLQMSQDSLETTIGDEAFASLTNLNFIWISQSKVRIIKRSMFPKEATSLAAILFTDNDISELPEDLFDNMPSLNAIFLDNNLIRRLPASPWSAVWEQLHGLNVAGNPLVCDSDMKWMFTKKRPEHLLGICHSPEKMIGTSLISFIKENS